MSPNITDAARESVAEEKTTKEREESRNIICRFAGWIKAFKTN